MTILKTTTRNIDNRRLLNLQVGKIFMAKLGIHVPWEGYGERAALMLLDRRRDLLGVKSQPEWMRVVVNGKTVTYTADYEVVFHLRPVEVWEIKGHRALQQEKTRDKLAAVDAAVARSGRIFRVFNSRELTDSIELRNVQLLRRYALCTVRSEQSAAVLSTFRAHDKIPLGALIDAAQHHGISREQVYALLYRGELTMDWNQLVCDDSSISLGTPGADL